MSRLRELVREPALIIDIVETGLIMLVAFGLDWSHDQQAYVIAALVAIAGVGKAITTSPFPVTLITDAGRAVLVLGASFGLSVSVDQIALIVTFLGTLMTLVARAQITPVSSPVTAPLGSGSGPLDATGDAPRIR